MPVLSNVDPSQSPQLYFVLQSLELSVRRHIVCFYNSKLSKHLKRHVNLNLESDIRVVRYHSWSGETRSGKQRNEKIKISNSRAIVLELSFHLIGVYNSKPRQLTNVHPSPMHNIYFSI